MDLSAPSTTASAAAPRRVGTIAWASAAMRTLEEDIAWASRFDVNIMISGEKGVGKRAVAFRLYRQSRRAPAPLLVVHAQDTAEPADTLTPRLLEAGRASTVLLDHPHWMSPTLQSRLLHFIERGMIEAGPGAPNANGQEVRFLTVAGRNLFDLVGFDRFSESLFYRLNTIHLIIPPLRERPEDIPVLLEHFLSVYARTSVPRLSADAWDHVQAYEWPGNVRELKSVAEVVASRDLARVIEPADLLPS
jgi:DNA-binding NtrC family response regulator